VIVHAPQRRIEDLVVLQAEAADLGIHDLEGERGGGPRDT
jgi:hypothetical protein